MAQNVIRMIHPSAIQNRTPFPLRRRRRSDGSWASAMSAAMTSPIPDGPATAAPESEKISVGLDESSGMADPGVEDVVQEVDEEVHEHEAHGEDDDAELHDEEVAAEDRLHGEVTHAREGED